MLILEAIMLTPDHAPLSYLLQYYFTDPSHDDQSDACLITVDGRGGMPPFDRALSISPYLEPVTSHSSVRHSDPMQFGMEV